MHIFRPIAAVALVVVIIFLGFSGMAQWIVLPLGALFTAAYIDSKWVVWQPLVQKRDSRFYQALVSTYLIETVIVFALYWLGRGVASLL